MQARHKLQQHVLVAPSGLSVCLSVCRAPWVPPPSRRFSRNQVPLRQHKHSALALRSIATSRFCLEAFHAQTHATFCYVFGRSRGSSHNSTDGLCQRKKIMVQISRAFRWFKFASPFRHVSQRKETDEFQKRFLYVRNILSVCN